MLFAGYGLRVQDHKGGDDTLIQTIIKSHALSTNIIRGLHVAGGWIDWRMMFFFIYMIFQFEFRSL